MAFRQILLQAASLTARSSCSSCSGPAVGAVLSPSRQFSRLQLPLNWADQHCRNDSCTTPAAAAVAQPAGSGWGAPGGLMAQLSDYMHAIGMWLACPKHKVSRHRRGLRRQHQRMSATGRMSQCGLCDKVFPVRTIMSSCKRDGCPSGPGKRKVPASAISENETPAPAS
mmetsp:Transcript_4904/g.14129  ORF Transcript_4904/g.14129 Transcript_4904/m.14129 type:complete len:169 (-) Transcript_4904:463-969(-)